MSYTLSLTLCVYVKHTQMSLSHIQMMSYVQCLTSCIYAPLHATPFKRPSFCVCFLPMNVCVCVCVCACMYMRICVYVFVIQYGASLLEGWTYHTGEHHSTKPSYQAANEELAAAKKMPKKWTQNILQIPRSNAVRNVVFLPRVHRVVVRRSVVKFVAVCLRFPSMDRVGRGCTEWQTNLVVLFCTRGQRILNLFQYRSQDCLNSVLFPEGMRRPTSRLQYWRSGHVFNASTPVLVFREWKVRSERRLAHREIEKFIIRQSPIGEKDDYDGENSWHTTWIEPSCTLAYNY